MGRSLDQHEILITPESKGKRCAPTARGRSVNASKLIARRQVGLKQTNIITTGRLESQSAYFERKREAVTLIPAHHDQALLQADRHRFNQSSVPPRFQLQTSFAGLDDTEYAPPDCQIGSGPDHLIVTVNASWAVFDRTGRQLLRRNFSDMFESLVENPVIFKPRVVYDQFRGGWLLSACAISEDQKQSWFFLAATHGTDPMGDWWIWAIDVRSDSSQPPLRPDALGLAVDGTSIYLTANMFTAQGQFAYSRLRVLSKQDLQIGGILHGWDFWQLKNFDGTPTFSLQPAVNLRQSDPQYLLNASSDGQSMTLWKVTQRLRQAPLLSRRSIAISPFQLAPNARQNDVEREIETGDTRVCQIIYRHGLLWGAQTISVNWGEKRNFSGIQWFQINPKAGFITHQGIFGAPGYSYFSPAVIVDQNGNMGMVFNRVGDTDPPAICYTGRLNTDEQNRLRESVELLQSSMPGACEWNGFSAASTSPEEDNLWFMGEYVATGSDWATWVGAINLTRQDSEPSTRDDDQDLDEVRKPMA